MDNKLYRERLDLRLYVEDRKLIERAAEAKGITMSAFVVIAARQYAQHVLRENQPSRVPVSFLRSAMITRIYVNRTSWFMCQHVLSTIIPNGVSTCLQPSVHRHTASCV